MGKWWDNPRIPLSAKTRLRVAWVIIFISIVGWPLSMVTFATQEPPAILALSWLAITITALDVVSTSDVSAEQEKE